MIVVKGEARSLKNSKQIVRPKKSKRQFIVASKLVQDAEQGVRLQLRQQWALFQKEITNKGLPIRLHLKFYRSTHRRFDYVNISQHILDCMVKEYYIADDSAQFLLPVFEPYEVDKANPRTEIWVE